MNVQNILVLAICLLTGRLMAQTSYREIRLLDAETSLPIVEATWEYGDQQGLSDVDGTVRFIVRSGQAMIVSHLNYGHWTLEEGQLMESVHYRSKRTVNLYPVIVIGLRPSERPPDEAVAIDYTERMEHDGADILNQIPAFNSIRKGGNYGFDPVFRGFKNDQLNVVLNGAQSATAACPNRMDPPTSQMAPNMTQRIEVLKGPYALRYGTGFGATINFVPSPLRFTGEPEVYGRISTGYEGNGNLLRGESQLGISGEKTDVSLFAAWSEGDDYRAGNGQDVQADFARGSFGTVLGWKLSDRQQLRLSATYNRARDADFPALPMDLRLDDTWMFNLRHDLQVNGERLQSWNTTLYGSFVDHLMNNLLRPLDTRNVNAETEATTRNYGGRTEGVWMLGTSSLYAGFDLRVEGAEGTRTREMLMGPMAGNTFSDNVWQDSRINRTAVFAEWQIPGKSLSYVLSGRLELNSAQIDDPADEFASLYSELDSRQLNPSFSLGVLKDLGEEIRTGIWLGRAQRSGGLAERYINFFPIGQDPFELIGNPELDPEVNNQVDLTLRWESEEGTALHIDLFGSYLQDFISSVIDPDLSPRLPMSPGVRRFVNIEDAYKLGFEFSWTQPLFAGLRHRLALAYTYAQDLERDEPLPEIAPLDLRYALLGSYFKGRLIPELTFRYVAEQSRVSDEFGENVTPSFSLLDVKVGYRLGSGLSLSAGVNNLLDENYFEHLNRSVRGTMDPIFAPGRNIFANLNWSF